MRQITFKAGYGDPYRTIAQKYRDYGKIDKYNNRISLLENAINELETQRSSLIALYNNVSGIEKEEIQEKIQKLTLEIELMKKDLEVNRNIVRSLWYGYHERD